MTESTVPTDNSDGRALENEIARLNKIIQALMDHAERSARVQDSDFGLLQTTIMLEEQVRGRTADLEAALRVNANTNRALRESEAKFRGLVSQPLAGIVIIEDGLFSYSNAKFDEMFGYSATEMRTLGPLDLSIRSGREAFAESMRQLQSGGADTFQRILPAARKDGAVIAIDIHAAAMEIDGKRALIGLVLDVTEATRIQRELRALQGTLREQSIHDSLTGLYNRRYVDETLGRELIAAERGGYPVSVIMGDLDHFKAVNDRYGHLGGDEVLRVFGNLMKRHARGSDIHCRYGGEEFLLVQPQMAEDVAIQRAEHLRSALAATRVPYRETHITVTASFGVAIFPRDGRTGDELIAAADSALYVAKASGRNRVSASSSLVTR